MKNQIIYNNEKKTRLDIFLKQNVINISRSIIIKSIENGEIIVNNKTVKKNYLLTKNDVIQIVNDKIFIKNKTITKVEKTNLEILYEDDYFLIINKPSGIAVHFDTLSKEQNLASHVYTYLLYPEDTFDDDIRQGIAHRLDKFTSGALIFAKSQDYLNKFINLFKERKVKKIYFAICKNKLKKNKIKLTSFMGRSKKYANLQDITNIYNPKLATTYFDLICYDEKENMSLIKCKPITGRTHQLRLHLLNIGCPILNDDKYGKNITSNHNEFGQFLHSYLLSFIHPITDKKIVIAAPFPTEFFNISPVITEKLLFIEKEQNKLK